MQFSCRTLKIVRTFLDRGSETKNNYSPSQCILKKEKSLNLANEIFYFTNKLNANVQNTTQGCYRLYEVVTSEVKKPQRFIKVYSKNLHAQTKLIKPLHIFFVAVYYHLVLTGKIKRDLQPFNIRQAILTLHKHKRGKNILTYKMNYKISPKYFLYISADRERKGQLVPVLLRITAERAFQRPSLLRPS